MKTLRILVADDEKPAREKIKSFLSDELIELEIFEAEDGLNAIEVINKNDLDLVFLDIQMPGKTGFEVIQDIGVEKMPTVVFVTAYDNYAINAFSVNAIDYLLKPFDKTRFKKSFQKVLKQIQNKHIQSDILNTLMAEVNPQIKYIERMMVRLGNKYIVLDIARIQFFEADGKYIKIFIDGHVYLERSTLSEMEVKLDPTQFVRIHRKHIVNIKEIKQLSARSHGDFWLDLKNGKRLVLSRRYKDHLFS